MTWRAASARLSLLAIATATPGRRTPDRRQTMNPHLALYLADVHQAELRSTAARARAAA